jgi:hypothetical protein
MWGQFCEVFAPNAERKEETEDNNVELDENENKEEGR